MNLIGANVGRLAEEIDKMISIRTDCISVNEEMENYLIQPYAISVDLMQSLPKNYIEETYSDQEWYIREKAIAVAMMMTITRTQVQNRVNLDNQIKEMLNQILGMIGESEKSNIDMEKIGLQVNLDSFMPHVTIYDSGYLKDDLYLKKIKMLGLMSGKYRIMNIKYAPGMFFWNGSYQENGYEYSIPLGCSNDEMVFPAIIENNNGHNEVVEALMPLEMNDAAIAATKAKGKVIVIGGVFGYFAYFAHLSKDVNEVVIVNENKDICEIMMPLLVQFDHNKKIKVVNENHLKYLKENASTADMVYVSRMNSVRSYLDIRDIERISGEKTIWHYCDFGTYLEQVKNSIWSIIGDKTYNDEPSGGDDYNIVNERLKDIKISNPDILRKLFMQNYLKEIF